MAKKVLSYVYIAFGSFLSAIGLNMFLIPNKLSAGGATGIATLLFIKLGIPVSITNLILNLILFVIAYKTISKSSVFKTVYACITLSLFLEITKNASVFALDMLLSSIYGGILLGAGVGICIANNASTGGSDLAAIMIKKLLPYLSVGKIILVIDAVIIAISAILFNDFTIALYCLFTLAINVKATDYIVDGANDAKSAFIISKKHEEIAEKVLYDFKRGVTGIKCKGMYTDNEKTALLCIVNIREVARLRSLVKEIDKNAFIILTDVHQTLGEGFSDLV